MNSNERQKEEIKTIKERTIKLRLSDADVKRLLETAECKGISVSELLENFIGDLVDGTYSNGSDERMYAEQWYDRCGFSNFAEMTFLRFVLLNGDIDEVMNFVEDIPEMKEELEDARNDDSVSPEELKYMQEDLNETIETFRKEYYEQYLEYVKNKDAESMEQAMDSIQKYSEDLEEFMQ